MDLGKIGSSFDFGKGTDRFGVASSGDGDGDEDPLSIAVAVALPEES